MLKQTLMSSSLVDSRQLSGLPRISEMEERQRPWLLSLHSANPTAQAPHPLRLAFVRPLLQPQGFGIMGGLRVHMTLPRAAWPSPPSPNQQFHLTYCQATMLGHLCHSSQVGHHLLLGVSLPPAFSLLFLNTEHHVVPQLYSNFHGHRVAPTPGYSKAF